MDHEKLAAFYLGRRHDFENDPVQAETILDDAKDLTTHAVCVGMTGSGKAELGVGSVGRATTAARGASRAARKSDIEVEELVLVWTPWLLGRNGLAEPADEPFPA